MMAASISTGAAPTCRPIWGVELDPETMTPIGEKKELIFGREEELGYERPGNNGIVDKESKRALQSP